MSEYDVRRLPGEAELGDAHAVRREVFIEEQDVSESEEMDGKDDESIHYVVYDEGRPIGTARLRFPDSDRAKSERVAVRKPYRHEGVGSQLMESLEAEAREQGYTRLDLHAQTTVEEFYDQLGYETNSDEFLEADIPHVKMTKILD